MVKTRLLLLAIALAAVPGCVQTESWVFSSKPHPANSGVSQIAMIWNGLGVTSDSANGGRTLPGFAGRLYLLGPDLATPFLCEGKVVVDMSIMTSEKQLKLMERWELDAKTLQRLVRKDVIGDGYTLFLPWAAYNPEITQAQMRVTFHPKNGGPVYGEPSMVNVRLPTHIPIEQRQVVPAK